jgi:zinc/manganese transport system substrate-binding protein/manganese/iron transport system substrate-binding protein
MNVAIQRLATQRARRSVLHRPQWSLAALLTLAILVAACGGSNAASSSGSAGTALDVVATTTVFADIVRNVGGDRVAVNSIVPPGAGPEDYEPKPGDARKLAGADLIVSNGVGLDDFLDKLVNAAGEGAVPRLVLGDGIPTITVDGDPNPHFWLDPTLVAGHYVPAIVARLGALDPTGAPTYAANADRYRTALAALDTANKTKIDTIPTTQRKLVTFHDAFPYFARHYGFELVGVILPNAGQEPSAKDLAALVDKVKASGTKAVFSEAQFSPELAKTLATEAGVSRVVSTLYNDTVGPPPTDTYLAMMTGTVDRIVEALR